MCGSDTNAPMPSWWFTAGDAEHVAAHILSNVAVLARLTGCQHAIGELHQGIAVAADGLFLKGAADDAAVALVLGAVHAEQGRGEAALCGVLGTT